MKDTIISVQRKKVELRWMGISLLIAFLLNIYAIAHFHSRWRELYTMIPTVIILAVVVYFLLIIVRLAARGLLRLLGRK